MPKESITINETVDENGVKTIEKIILRQTSYSTEQAARIKEYQRTHKEKISEITKRYYQKRKLRELAKKQDVENTLAKEEGREPIVLELKTRTRKPKVAEAEVEAEKPVQAEEKPAEKPKRVRKVKIKTPEPESPETPVVSVELAPVPQKKPRKPRAKKELPVA